MNSRQNSRLLLCLASLVFGLVAFRMIAIAGDEGGSSQRFSLKLSGGLRWASLGDIGTYPATLDGYLYDACLGINYLPGQLKKPGPLAPDLDLEIRMDLGKNYSLSVAIGFSPVTDKSRSFGVLQYWQEPEIIYRSLHTSFRSDIRSIPVRLDLVRRWPLSHDWILFIGAGISACFTRVDLERSMTFYPLLWSQTAPDVYPGLHDTFKLHGIGFGPVGKVGTELRLSRPASLVFEIEGLFVKVRRLKGSRSYWYWSWIDDMYYLDGDSTGSLQIGTSDMTIMGLTENFPDLSVTPSTPMSPARVDLSGFTCRLGLRYRF